MEQVKKEQSKHFMRKNSMRNKTCPCKSGKKFKHCCWAKLSPRQIRG